MTKILQSGAVFKSMLDRFFSSELEKPRERRRLFTGAIIGMDMKKRGGRVYVQAFRPAMELKISALDLSDQYGCEYEAAETFSHFGTCVEIRPRPNPYRYRAGRGGRGGDRQRDPADGVACGAVEIDPPTFMVGDYVHVLLADYQSHAHNARRDRWIFWVHKLEGAAAEAAQALASGGTPPADEVAPTPVATADSTNPAKDAYKLVSGRTASSLAPLGSRVENGAAATVAPDRAGTRAKATLKRRRLQKQRSLRDMLSYAKAARGEEHPCDRADCRMMRHEVRARKARRRAAQSERRSSEDDIETKEDETQAERVVRLRSAVRAARAKLARLEAELAEAEAESPDEGPAAE
jgi:hypothetical protein